MLLHAVTTSKVTSPLFACITVVGKIFDSSKLDNHFLIINADVPTSDAM